MGKLFRKLIILNLALVSAAAADFTADCPDKCQCGWASGNKQANCSNSQLREIPKTLSTEIQILDLTGNELHEVPRDAFFIAGLINLKKLFLRDCKLTTIHKNSLNGLAILVALDLSKNNLKILQPDTFKETNKVRSILLNDNEIEKLEDGLFNNLPFLQNVDLSNNKIVQIGMTAFLSVPRLNTLRLNGNKLKQIETDALKALTSLSNLDVQDNPWHCDCYLQPFVNWVSTENLCTSSIACAEPAKVAGKLWQDLKSSDFVCQPSSISPSENSNLTLSCHVNGNSYPEVKWVLNLEIVDGTYRYQGKLKENIQETAAVENSKWVNLTVVGASADGEYLCLPKNAVKGNV